jgi:hypothetical protein
LPLSDSGDVLSFEEETDEASTDELLGPSTLGTQRLLAHWAARDGGVKVSEDELLAEVRSVGADEWEQAVAEAERNLPGTSNAAPQGERS